DEKCTGSVSALGFSRGEANLPEESGLLIANDAGDGDPIGKEARSSRVAEDLVVVQDLGQERRRNPQDLKQVARPLAGLEVHEGRAGGVGDVRDMGGPPRQAPREKSVDRSEEEPSRLRLSPRSAHLLENPGQLGAREVGIQPETGLSVEEPLEPCALELV